MEEKTTHAWNESPMPEGYWRAAGEGTAAGEGMAAPSQGPASPEHGLPNKAHLTRTTGSIREEAAVPEAVKAVYRELFAGWSDAQIAADYKKHK